MELYDLINFIKKKKLELLSMGVFFGLVGVGVYFLLPEKYIAVTHIFVSREVQLITSEDAQEPSNFAYEGYYAQQNAINYTTTLLGLLESDSIKGAFLQKRNIPINSHNLRIVGRSMSFKRQAPQVLEVTFKAGDKNAATSKLDTLLEVVLEKHSHLTAATDPLVHLKLVSDVPVVKTPYKNPFLNFGVGFIGGFAFTLILLALQDYLANGKKTTSKEI